MLEAGRDEISHQPKASLAIACGGIRFSEHLVIARDRETSMCARRLPS